MDGVETIQSNPNPRTTDPSPVQLMSRKLNPVQSNPNKTGYLDNDMYETFNTILKKGKIKLHAAS